MASATYGTKSIPFTLRLMQTFFRRGGHIAPGLVGRVAFRMFCTPMKRVVPDFSQTGLPAPESIRVAHKGGTLQGYAWGEGPTVLMIHGWESSSQRFEAFVMPLVEAGFRVVAVDGPAHGASSGKQTNPIIHAEGLHTFVQHIGPLHGIVAHSFGTGATAALLSLYDIDVERVVLIATLNRTVDSMAMFAQVVGLPKRAFEGMVRFAESTVGKTLDAFDVAQIAASRTERALIIHDEKDRITPLSNAQAVAKAWPNAELINTRGLGHRRILKSQDVVEKTVRFMEA